MLRKMLSLGLLAHTASGAVFEGETDTNEFGFQFISKFCFDVARPKGDPDARAGEIAVEFSMADGSFIPLPVFSSLFCFLCAPLGLAASAQTPRYFRE